MSRQADALGAHGRAVADKVRFLRHQRGYSLRVLAEKTQRRRPTLGTDAINKVELGARRIDIDDLFALAEALDVTPAQLLEQPDSCSTCGGTPPPGYSCLACGATTPAA